MKKIIILLISLLLLSSCSFTKPSVDNNNDKDYLVYLNNLENYQSKDKNVNNTVDDEDFDEFLNNSAIYFLGQDYLNMHYSVVDYRSFNIPKPEVSLGEIKYGFDQDIFDKEVDLLNKLHEFDYDKLSYRQQYDYEALEYSFYEDLASSFFYKYGFIMSYNNNYPESIFSNLVDFTFYDEESVDDYLLLMKDYSRFLEDAYQYVTDQQKDGIYLLDEWIDYTKEAIEGILNRTDDNDLIVSFDERIDKLTFIDDVKKQEVKKTNRELVLNEVLPAYEKLLGRLDEFMGKADTSKSALVNLNKDYARLNLIINTSNNDSVDETIDVLLQAINYYEMQFISLFDNEDLYNEFDELYSNLNEPLQLTGVDGLYYLEKNMQDYYKVVDAQFDVQMLNEDTASDSVVGYYYQAPIDNREQNIIRLNPNNMDSGIATYITLAHEGFPGHLYQNYAYSLTNPSLIRKTISFIGYTEGYALLASNDALHYAGQMNSAVADSLFYNEELYFYIESLLDILVNNKNYSVKQLKDFFEQNCYLQYFDDEGYESLREAIIAYPGVYSRYAIGASKLLDYRLQLFDSEKSNKDLVALNELIITNGPLPFAILDKTIETYLK